MQLLPPSFSKRRRLNIPDTKRVRKRQRQVGVGTGGHLLNHFRPHIPVTPAPVIRDHKTQDLKLSCNLLSGCLLRQDIRGQPRPPRLFMKYSGWLLGRSIRWEATCLLKCETFIWTQGAMERCLAYDSWMSQLLERLFGRNLTAKSKPVLPLWFFKKRQSGWVAERRLKDYYWNESRCCNWLWANSTQLIVGIKWSSVLFLSLHL